MKVSCDDLPGLEKTLAEAMDSNEPALVIAYAPCRIAAKLTKEGLCEVDSAACKACGACFKLGCPAMTLEEIGENLDLTRERVRQLKMKAINKLSSPKVRSRLVQYL